MLKFVQKWIREKRDEAEITADGTVDKWTKCEDGLPSSDRKVEVMVYSPAFEGYTSRRSAGMDICFAQFNPHVGWKMEKSGVVVAWRDMDKEYRNMINDLDWCKYLLSDKIKD